MNDLNNDPNAFSPDDRVINFLRESIRYNSKMVQFIDQKTHLLVAAIGILIPLIIVILNTIAVQSVISLPSVIVVGYALSVLLLFICLFCCFFVIVPRNPQGGTDGTKKRFYGSDIIEEELTEYSSKVKDYNLNKIYTEYILQAYTLGLIMKSKVKWYRTAILTLIPGFSFLLVSFFLNVISTIISGI